MKKLLVLLILFIIGSNVYAQLVTVRPDANIGFYSSGDTREMSYSYGGKILLMANNFQRYGILINHLLLGNDQSFLSVGIYLEQVIFQYFNMGIGTVGYIGLKNKENPFGIYSHLGFEYPFAERFHFLAAYQSDHIFAKQYTSNNAFMFGVGVQF